MATIATGHTDQATRLRALVEALAGARAHAPAAAASRRVPVVAIASGKGGVGKTNLAVNLSIALARSGKRIILFDADLGMANADVLCGLSPGRRLDQVLAQGGGLASCIVQAPGGFLLVPGAVGVARVADLDSTARRRLVEQLGELETRSDIVLVDTGAGIGRDVLSFAGAADRLLVVVTPEPTSITDAYGLVKCAVARARADAAPMPRIGLVVNEVRGRAEAERVSAKLSMTCERFLGSSTHHLGFVRRDERVARAVRARTPHTLAWPRSPASRDVRVLAGELGRWLASPA